MLLDGRDQALAAARNKILAGECDVALVVGADTTPKGFLAPAKGYRPEDPDWVRFYLGITNPTYFALYARRRMDLYGDTLEDFAAVKVKNSRIGSTISQVFQRRRRRRLRHGRRSPAVDGYLCDQRWWGRADCFQP